MCHIRKHSSQQINLKNWPLDEELWRGILQSYSPVGTREGEGTALCTSRSWCLAVLAELVRILCWDQRFCSCKGQDRGLGSIFSSIPSQRQSPSLPLPFLMCLQKLGFSKCCIPLVPTQASPVSCDPHNLCIFIWVEDYITVKKQTKNPNSLTTNESASGTHTWVLQSWSSQRWHAVQPSSFTLSGLNSSVHETRGSYYYFSSSISYENDPLSLRNDVMGH